MYSPIYGDLRRHGGRRTGYCKRSNRHEHRLVAEIKLGRALMHNEVVHHIDGNKQNNEPDNLMIMTQSDHLKLHRSFMMEMRKEKAGY